MARIAEKFLAQDYTQETPSGVVNGVNCTFTVSTKPEEAEAVLLTQNGLMLRQPTHYTITGQTITFVTPPAPGQELCVYYPQK